MSNHLPARRRSVAGVLLLLLMLVAVVLAAMLATRSGREAAQSIGSDLKWVERQMRLKLGWPLRGTPDLARFEERLREKNLAKGAPVFMRIFKWEHELELWMKKGDRFVLFTTYPICRWSGRLGPKLREGDHQSPEGFYTVARGQLNPNSKWHRSFNLGFPNGFDRIHGRSGSFLMVHGGCSSIGCYAMTDPVIDEIWSLITAAFDAGQPLFHVHVYPFRMSGWKLTLYGNGRWDGFWRDLKRGSDLFERSHMPPAISVCRRRYAFEKAPAGKAGMTALRSGCPAALTLN
ncbi:MAG: murein L,D-transpeptidase family protein [Pseudomonadota bacterium]|nr:murein L,D-transpeptidase family protein [Pseudomonadota bacterium]